MDAKEIIKRIRSNDIITPGELAEYRLKLAAEYGFLSDQLFEILKVKPSLWMEIRKREEIKSDKLTDKFWETTELGIKETELRLFLRQIEKVMSAINTRLRTYENESKNSY